VWGGSLDQGDILYVATAMIDGAHRGKGLFPQLMAALSTEAAVESFRHACFIVRPGTMKAADSENIPKSLGLAPRPTDVSQLSRDVCEPPTEAQQQQCDAAAVKVDALCRRSGFRRVGASAFWARVANAPLHPCLDTAAADAAHDAAALWPGRRRAEYDTPLHPALIPCARTAALVSSRPHARCSCGQCVGGYLSPRSRHVLQYLADAEIDALDSAMRGFQPDQAQDRHCLHGTCEFFAWAGGAVPRMVFRAYLAGIAEILKALTNVMRQERMPTAADVSFAAQHRDARYVAHFVEHDGSVHMVVTFLLNRARRVLRAFCGDGLLFGAGDAAADALPRCDCDFAWHEVLACCGASAIDSLGNTGSDDEPSSLDQ
jgi:L-amino acid N-acyltransferase YncA